MQDLLTRVSTLSRPRLLVRAAHAGTAHYNRTKDLRRVLKQDSTPTLAPGLMRLMDLEQEINHRRRQGDPGYTFGRHVEILTALLAEAETYLAAQRIKKGGSPVREPPKSVLEPARLALT